MESTHTHTALLVREAFGYQDPQTIMSAYQTLNELLCSKCGINEN